MEIGLEHREGHFENVCAECIIRGGAANDAVRAEQSIRPQNV